MLLNGYTYDNGVLAKDITENNIVPGEVSTENKSAVNAEKSQKNQLEIINNQVKDIIENYKTNPETIAELLAFKEQFYKYSIGNTMLVKEQNKGATFVQSFDAWKKDGYSVQKGEKGLKVLVPTNVTYLHVPGVKKPITLSAASKELVTLYKKNQIESSQKKVFKVGNVFDISQTNVPKENYPDYYSMGYENADYDKIIKGISKYSNNELNCPVQIEDLKSIAVRGSYYPGGNYIELNQLLESNEKLSTLTHELGHAILHKAMESQVSASKIEFEADCMSVMLESHFGIELTDSRKDHIATHYKKLESELATENLNFDFKDILNDVFKKYEGIIENIDKYVAEEINMEKTNDLPKETELQEKIIVQEDVTQLVSKMTEVEKQGLIDGVELGIDYGSEIDKEEYFMYNSIIEERASNLESENILDAPTFEDIQEDIKHEAYMKAFDEKIELEVSSILKKDINTLTQKDIETFSENEFMLQNNYNIFNNDGLLNIKIVDNIKNGKYITSAGEYEPIDLLKQIKEAALVDLVNTNNGQIPFEDYQKIVANLKGFDSYEEMAAEGYLLGIQGSGELTINKYVPSGNLVSRMMESENANLSDQDYSIDS